MAFDVSAAKKLIENELFPAWSAEREHLDKIDRWLRWDHDKPFVPRQATHEYRELSARSQTPWLDLVVTVVAQQLYAEGYRSSRGDGNSRPWDYWQINGMDRSQTAVHRAALGYGSAYTLVLGGQDRQGNQVPVIKGISPREMIAFYRDDLTIEDYPEYAMRVQPTRLTAGEQGYLLTLIDDAQFLQFTMGVGGTGLEYIGALSDHGLGFCPVIRYTNRMDLEGRTPGEVEPYIPLAARIDQTTFDRLIVQRFASWVVRTISGMAKPEDMPLEDWQEIQQVQKLALSVDSILVAEDPDTKFGTLAATPLEGFISAKEADIRDLSAVSQTPPHALLGQIANLSAEALVAASASSSQKVTERQHSLGESHELTLRTAALVVGDLEAAYDFDSQIRWRDMTARSLAQIVDALGKEVQMLGLPPEIAWEKLPDMTQQDVERAKYMAQQADAMGQLLSQMATGVQGFNQQAQQNGGVPGVGTTAGQR